MMQLEQKFIQALHALRHHRLHFLSDNRRAGGHVLALELEHGQLAIDDTSNFHIELPTDGSYTVFFLHVPQNVC